MELISTHCCRLWHSCKFKCSLFSKARQPFDFIKPNVIRKLAYKVKYISQITVGLIMFFFANLSMGFFNPLMTNVPII